MNPSTPPKGSLEDLFRHHLLESEAAAVPPRPQVWEQLDNSLLIAQNEKYRQRLRVHRWAIAASLLLAMLSGGGWWHSQQRPATPLAQATSTGTEALNPAAQAGANRIRSGQPAVNQSIAIAKAPATAGSTASTSIQLSIGQNATSSINNSSPATAALATTGRSPGLAAAGNGRQLAARVSPARTYAAFGATTRLSAVGASGSAARGGALPVAQASVSRTYRAEGQQTASPTASGVANLPTESAVISSTVSLPDGNGQSSLTALRADTQAKPNAEQATAAEALAMRQAQLALAATQALPATLAALALPETPAASVTRRWQLGLSFAASTFQPNIDFARAPGDYNMALGVKSAALTRTAAAEYRNNLHAGLGGRLSLWATRRLGNGRFGLRTGLEVAQNTASSASSLAFVGEQVPDLGYTMPAPLQNTSYRYRSASVPVELRYGNPAKAGFSFYSHLGGLLTALLNVRSDVAGNLEATRTYTFVSASSPYRRLSASVRGGVGMQYRPSGHQWALSLGPIAEAGVLSLNADPNQDFWSQKRPYSFGLEAGVELGRTPRLLLK